MSAWVDLEWGCRDYEYERGVRHVILPGTRIFDPSRDGGWAYRVALCGLSYGLELGPAFHVDPDRVTALPGCLRCMAKLAKVEP